MTCADPHPDGRRRVHARIEVPDQNHASAVHLCAEEAKNAGDVKASWGDGCDSYSVGRTGSGGNDSPCLTGT